jgi:hypothetical protein
MTTLQRILLTVFFCLAGSVFVLPPPDAQAASYSGIWGDNQHEWITNVTFGNINNTSAQNKNGYGDYTFDKSGLSTRVRANGTYPLSVTIHPDVEWCDEFLTAFFDWNHDGDFADAGETVILATRTCSPGPHKVNVKVPANARGGEVRMRIVVKYYNPPPSYGDIDEGEAEDYTVLVDYPAVIGDNRLEWITNVTIEDINNTTGPAANGYGNYTLWTTGRAAEVVQNEKYRLSVSIAPDTDFCDENITAFVDWNQDGDFGDAGERVVVASSTCSPGPHAVFLKVPINAEPGRTLMRVILRWKYAPVPSGYISGEGEDYTLFVKKRDFPWHMFIPAVTGMGR